MSGREVNNSLPDKSFQLESFDFFLVFTFYLVFTMKKEYIYNPRHYLLQVTITSWFCVLLICLALYMILINVYRGVFCLAGLGAFYTAWNAFVSGSNPSKVLLEEDGISFVSYGRTTKYFFEEITKFLAKDFRYSGKVFLRINKYNFFKGRYWLHTKEFNDSDELFLFLLKLEYKTHPDSIKSRAWDSTRPEVDKMPVLPWNLPKEEKPASPQ